MITEKDLRNTLFRVRGILDSESKEMVGRIVREITQALGDDFMGVPASDPQGKRNGLSAPTTPAQVLEIKHSHLSNVKLAAIYPASATQIQRIKTGQSWGHLCE